MPNTIDLTLEELQVPAVPLYTPNFGTKKASGGLSTEEVCRNMEFPWRRSKPIEITADSETKAPSYNSRKPVQADATLVFTASQPVTFTLGEGEFVGVRVTAYNTSSSTQSISAVNVTDPNTPTYDTHTVLEGDRIVLVWNGTAWQNISPVDTVADGNMNPVTSNAVYNKFKETSSYSTTGIKTGGTWVDGKPIYRMVTPVITKSLPHHSSTNIITFSNYVTNFGRLIKWDEISEDNTYCFKSAAYLVSVNNTTGISAYQDWTGGSSTTKKYRILFEYTKTTD